MKHHRHFHFSLARVVAPEKKGELILSLNKDILPVVKPEKEIESEVFTGFRQADANHFLPTPGPTAEAPEP